MKQLLDCSGHYLIGGWGDRAFVGCLGTSQIYELERSPLPPMNHDTSGAPAAATDDEVNAREQEIQAVAVCNINNGPIWCAVARHDKSLSLYCVEKSIQDETSERLNQSSIVVQPCTTYKTTKRVTSLCFASIPDENDIANDLTVVIAADLAGDAVAFALEREAQPCDGAGITHDTEEESVEDARFRRLLLGHTATMLTCVRVVGDGAQQRILTADRDEKIRVSSFPNTHIIEGFLLGHEAFVSCLDVAREDHVTRCVSCSGDGTVRMWDYLTHSQLGQFTLVGDDGTSDGVLPTRVAMNTRGSTAIVCTDDQDFAQVLHWKADNTGFGLLINTIHVGTTLAALWIDNEFFVAMSKAPQCLQVFSVSSDDEANHVRAVDGRFPFIDAMNKYATSENLALPASVLERDDFGVLKMQKQEEKRISNTDRAWNDAGRIETAKARDKRYKKRKIEQAHAH
ncbi:WD repeat-containing protein 4 [Mayamaea pseudoterrestris]|nr:WD repeat-containing protein 4 [Mayamaea pseudoterrestris]